MKTRFFLALILTFACGAFAAAEARPEKQPPRQQREIQINKQKTFPRSDLTVRFASLVEDSRCPVNATCVWAGNARIRIEVGKGRAKKTFELNTNAGQKSAIYKGYKIELVSLTPEPRENIRINRNGYVAAIAVSRLTR